jgi:fructose-bisphosphate aldolase class II
MNVDTDMQYAYTRAIASHVFESYDGALRVDGRTGNKKTFDPRVWGRKGEEAVAGRVTQACRDLRSAGGSILGTPTLVRS